MAKSFNIVTFGCKSNQYDSQLWRRLFLDAGWKESPEAADVCLVNTCTVTAAADRQARQAVRRIRKHNAGAKIIVAGCAGEVAAGAFAKMPEAGLVVGRHGRENAEKVNRFLGMADRSSGGGIDRFSGHTRAFIKVQDGCSHACSYCIVPRARGASRSRDLAEVVAEAQRLLAAGHRELVLTGIRLGDFKPSLGLLLATLSSLPGLGRLRLSSLEPDDVDRELVETLARLPKAARHLHLPLQSGSDRILAAMGRPYSLERYRETLGKVAGENPGVTFGTDLMVGFPGETEEDFMSSLRAAVELPISHLHVFSYSRRPGTRAAVMSGQVPEAIKRERSLRLREAFEAKRRCFWQGLVGGREEVLFESFEGGWWSGLSEHYFRVRTPSPEALGNQFRRVRLVSVGDDCLGGELEP